MSTYPQDGARPDALALNAAYKAVDVSRDEAFAGDPQQIAGRFTAWVQAAAALSRNLAAERHRAPKFQETLDTFISSATRLASRTQATAHDPAAWARVYGHIPSTGRPAAGLTPSPAHPQTGPAEGTGTAAAVAQAGNSHGEQEGPARPAVAGNSQRTHERPAAERKAATAGRAASPAPGTQAKTGNAEPPVTPVTNNDLAVALRRMPGWRFAGFVSGRERRARRAAEAGGGTAKPMPAPARSWTGMPPTSTSPSAHETAAGTAA
jgi:hypothetical protein